MYQHSGNARRRLRVLLFVLVSSAAFSVSADGVTFVHTDHLGTPVAYTNAKGEVIGEEATTPYGESLNSPTSNDLPSYTGHVRDGATGLVYMQARYYDPVVGRFLSTDPVTFETGKINHFNRYWYANGNPLLFVDPTGKSPCEGSSVVECIEADNAEGTDNASVLASSDIETEMIENQNLVEGDINDGDKTEKLAFISESAEGQLETELASDVTTGQNSANGTDVASATADSTTKAVLHGHIDGKTDGVLSSSVGIGDAQPLTKGLPNGVVSEGRVGVWERNNGVVRFRMVKGKMTRREARKLQENLDTAQKFFNNANSGE